MMRKFTLGWIAVAALLLAGQEMHAAEEGHVLAKKSKGNSQPAGTKVTKNSLLEITDAKLTVEVKGQPPMAGTMSRKDTEVNTLEILSATKARRLLQDKETSSAMIINGQERPMGDKPESLKGVPVILEEKEDGTYTATLEAGEATAAQTEDLTKLAKGLGNDSDLAIYGETPRKPGDKWTVDPKKIKAFGEAEDLAGTYTVEFVEVKDFQGTPCAVLKSEFEVTGAALGGAGMKMGFKGTAVTHRSLADRVDLETKMESTMTMEGQPNPQVTMHVTGPFKMTQTGTVKKP
ncbi:hypothetical protein [Luteolibacter sp. Populi]|uniref:hypothetical protein n=1 Tax=Luteolibacter sp. Populi TaxID=3230487 RepID=UPI0034676B22